MTGDHLGPKDPSLYINYSKNHSGPKPTSKHHQHPSNNNNNNAYYDKREKEYNRSRPSNHMGYNIAVLPGNVVSRPLNERGPHHYPPQSGSQAAGPLSGVQPTGPYTSGIHSGSHLYQNRNPAPISRPSFGRY